MTVLSHKIQWLREQLGLNVYDMPLYKKGELKAKDFPKFIDDILYWIEKGKGWKYPAKIVLKMKEK